MTISKWWMRAVGLFYLLIFVMAAFVKAPIREEGPAGALDLAARGVPSYYDSPRDRFRRILETRVLPAT